MEKKLLSILLVLSLMLALVPAAFAAGDVTAELESDGTTLTFSGSGTASLLSARSAGAAASHAGAAIRKAARRRFRNRFSAFFIVHNSARSRRNSQPNSP